CMRASEQGQLHRVKGQLLAARDELRACARDACPRVVRTDCAQALADIDRALPTIVPAASGGGRDLTEVRLSIDGARVAVRLDGTAVPVDPGEHTLHFEADGFLPVDPELVARAGGKARLVSARPAPAAPPEPARAPAPVVARDTGPASSSGGPPALAFVAGGVAIAALGLAAYFEVDSLNRYASLKDSCAPTHACTQSDVDAITRERLF